jgi:hypothetical protein
MRKEYSSHTVGTRSELGVAMIGRTAYGRSLSLHQSTSPRGHGGLSMRERSVIMQCG